MIDLNNLLDEQSQLQIKLDNLDKFLISSDFMKLDITQRNLLINQQYHMSEYLKILTKRIKDINSKLTK